MVLKILLLQENLVYESIGHSYFIEDGSETGNRFISNIAINTRRPRTLAEESPDSNDFEEPTNFWIENADNIFRG